MSTSPGWEWRYVVPARVIDGDTYALDIDLGFGIEYHGRFRLRGVDCPGLGTPEGDRARTLVSDVLAQGIQSLRSYKTQTFARWLADVTLADGSDLAAWIVAHGLGRSA